MSKIEGTFAVYWPRGQRTLDVEAVAPKVDSLSGKVVAFLWDYLFRGDEIFAILKRESWKLRYFCWAGRLRLHAWCRRA